MSRTTTRTYACSCGKMGMVSKRVSGFSVTGSLDIPHCPNCGRVVCTNCSELGIGNECMPLLSPETQSKVHKIIKALKSDWWCIISLIVGESIGVGYWLREEEGFSFIALIMGFGISFAIGIPLMYITEAVNKGRKRSILRAVRKEFSSIRTSGPAYGSASGSASASISRPTYRSASGPTSVTTSRPTSGLPDTFTSALFPPGTVGSQTVKPQNANTISPEARKMKLNNVKTGGDPQAEMMTDMLKQKFGADVKIESMNFYSEGSNGGFAICPHCHQQYPTDGNHRKSDPCPLCGKVDRS